MVARTVAPFTPTFEAFQRRSEQTISRRMTDVGLARARALRWARAAPSDSTSVGRPPSWVGRRSDRHRPRAFRAPGAGRRGGVLTEHHLDPMRAADISGSSRCAPNIRSIPWMPWPLPFRTRRPAWTPSPTRPSPRRTKPPSPCSPSSRACATPSMPSSWPSWRSWTGGISGTDPDATASNTSCVGGSARHRPTPAGSRPSLVA